LRTNRQIVRTRLAPAIGSVRVRKLRAQQLDQLYGALMREGALSPTTVRQVHSVIRRALAQAVRWGWVPVNVAANASPPRARKPQLGPPMMADVQKILAPALEENTELGVFVDIVDIVDIVEGSAGRSLRAALA
jgi:integrase